MNRVNRLASIVRSSLQARQTPPDARTPSARLAPRTMLALEPRFMFDAAGVASAADAASQALPEDVYRHDASDDSTARLVSALADQSPAAAHSGASQERTEIVFIDTSIKNWAMLREGVRSGVEVVLLDANRNGLEQMAQALAGRGGLDAIHVLSHGSDGEVQLGNLALNSSSVGTQSDALARIGAALAAEGDLLLYGCDVGSERGQAFISMLAAATGADIAASNDATGAAAFGGNWALETTRGEIETGAVLLADAQQAYRGLLAAGSLTFSAPHAAYLGTIVTDEMGFTTDIAGITYQIYSAASGSPGESDGTNWRYWEDLLGGAPGVNDGIFGDDDLGDPIIVIKSSDGSEFDFRGLAVVSYLGAQTHVTIEGFRDGVSTGSVTLEIDQLNWNSTFGTAQLTRSIFENVDEVRLTNPDEMIGPDRSYGYVNYIALQNLVFGEPVGNVAPTANGNLNQTKTVSEGGSTIALDDIVVSDPDAGDTITATFTLSTPGAGTLSTGTYGSATSTFNAATGVWTVTGSVADVNAALAAVTLTPSANNDQNFTITTRIRDAANTGPADGTITVSVTAVNDAPILDPSAELALDVDEDAGAPVAGVASGTLITALVGGISDPDTGALQGIAIVGADTSRGMWWFTTNGGASWSALGSPSANAARLLSSDANTRLHFQPNAEWSGTLSAALTIRAWDRTAGSNGGQANITVVGTGGTTPFSTATDTVALTVNAINDAPVATVPASISITEDTASALTGISFTDPDAGSSSVTVTLSVPAGALGATSGAGVVIGGTASALTLTGSIANINAFIAASNVTYTPALNDNGTRVLTVGINDGGNTGSGGALTDTATVDLNIAAVNDGPVATVPASISVVEDVATSLTGISFSDVDAGAASMTVTLSVPSGTLAATSGGGVIVGGTSSALTLSGALADINAFIAASNVTFTTALDATADVTLTVTVDDGGNTGAGGAQQAVTTVTLDVTAVNDAPQVTAPSSIGLTVNEAAALTGISFADIDAGTSLVTATFSVPSGTLTAASGGGVIVGGTSSALTLTGTLANINAFIAASNVTFTTALNATANVTLTVSINDNGSTGIGGARQDSTTVTLTAAERPTISVGGGSPAYAEDGAATVVASGLTITDSDSPSMVGATVIITDFIGGDVLGFSNQNGIVGSYDAATGVLTLTGSATRAQYEAALRSITYSSTNDNPATGAGNGNRVIEFRVNDGELQSEPGITQTVTVTNVNDAPVLDDSQSPTLHTLSEDAAAPSDGSTAGSTLVSGLTGGISDVDTGALGGIAIIGASEHGTLWYSTNNGLTWTQAAALSEDAALLLASDARLYFQPNANVSGVLADAITFRAWDRTTGINGGTADTRVNGGTTAFSIETDTASISITAVNDAPTVSSNPTLTGMEDAVLTIVASDLNFADVDAGDSLQSIIVTGLPTNGTLFLDVDGNGALDDGEAIAQGQVITRGDIDAGRLSYIAAANAHGAGYASFDYTVSDGIVSSAPATATIDITPVNDAPSAAGSVPAIAGRIGESLRYALPNGLFADVDAGDSLTLSMSDLPEGLSFDAATGVISGIPTGAAGERIAQLIATDRAGATASIALILRLEVAAVLPEQPEPEPQPQPQPQPQPGPHTQPHVSQLLFLESDPRPLIAQGQAIAPSADISMPASSSEPVSLSFTARPTFARPATFSDVRGTSQDVATSMNAGSTQSSGTVGTRGFLTWSSSRADASGGGIEVQNQPPDIPIGRDASGSMTFSLPPRTFVAHDAGEIAIEASLANGRPLPPWVRFNPREGMFIVDPPVGFEGTLDVRVTARTDQGRSATVDFKIVVEKRGAGSSVDTAEQARAEVASVDFVQALAAAYETAPQVADEESASAPIGKSSLSEQLRAAGESRLLAEAAEILERLVDASEEAA